MELVGEYQGSGLTQVTFLARNASGRVVQLSRLLWLVLSGVDGSRTVGEIAARVSVEFGRTVSAGNVEYLLENKLTPLGLVAGGEDAAQPATAGPDAAILALRLRGTLIPEAGVQVVARLFGPLFLPPVVVVVLGLLAAADVWLVRSGGLLAAFGDVLARPLLLLVLVGLAAVSMVFHECGHAAACRYGGARPGRIGMGLYVLWPALFTNVTDSYRLGRAGRIRTDLGGVYFNAVFAVVLAGAYQRTGYLPLAAAVLLVQLEIAQQLLPTLRLDGYFILTDLVGVPDLFRKIGPVLRSLVPGQRPDPRVGVLRRASRVALTAWVAVIVPLLGGELVLILLGYPPAGHRVRAVHDHPGGRHDSAVRPGRGRGRAGQRDLGGAAGHPGRRDLLPPAADRAGRLPRGGGGHPQAPGPTGPAGRRGDSGRSRTGRLMGIAAATRRPPRSHRPPLALRLPLPRSGRHPRSQQRQATVADPGPGPPHRAAPRGRLAGFGPQPQRLAPLGHSRRSQSEAEAGSAISQPEAQARRSAVLRCPSRRRLRRSSHLRRQSKSAAPSRSVCAVQVTRAVRVSEPRRHQHRRDQRARRSPAVSRQPISGSASPSPPSPEPSGSASPSSHRHPSHRDQRAHV